MKRTYLAVFKEAAPDERGFSVQFPDVPNAITEGDTVEEAVENAADVLGTMLCLLEDEGKPFPAPSPVDGIILKDNQLLRPITVDLDACRRMLDEIDQNPIRWAREQVGMSIKEMADYLEVPYRTAQEWNAGRVRPPRWCEQLVFDKILQAK